MNWCYSLQIPWKLWVLWNIFVSFWKLGFDKILWARVLHIHVPASSADRNVLLCLQERERKMEKMQVMLKKIRPSPKQAKVNICFCQKSYRHYILSLLNSPEGCAKKFWWPHYKFWHIALLESPWFSIICLITVMTRLLGVFHLVNTQKSPNS